MGDFHKFVMVEFYSSGVDIFVTLGKYGADDRQFAMADLLMSRLYIQTHMTVKLTHAGLCRHHVYGNRVSSSRSASSSSCAPRT